MTVTAYFDFDGTLIAGDSDELFHQHSDAAGKLTDRQRAMMDRMMADYRAGTLTAATFRAFQLERVRGWTPEAFRAAGVACFHERVRPLFFREALPWLAWHRGHGHRVVLLSGGPAALIAEAGRHLGTDAAFGCAVEVRHRAFGDRTEEPMPFGAGKIAVAEADARGAGCALADCYFYSDSPLDLPLLERVGTAVVVNPGEALAAAAAARGWRQAFVRHRSAAAGNRRGERRPAP